LELHWIKHIKAADLLSNELWIDPGRSQGSIICTTGIAVGRHPLYMAAGVHCSSLAWPQLPLLQSYNWMRLPAAVLVMTAVPFGQLGTGEARCTTDGRRQGLGQDGRC
jgi:hypothetical protein